MATVQAKVERSFEIPIHYELLSDLDGKRKLVRTKQVLASVVFSSVYPRMIIANARCEGLSKPHVWESFGLTQLNRMLCPKDFHEAVFSNVNFKFPPNVIGQASTVLKLQLSNPGVCDVNWAFVFPFDEDYKPEIWAENPKPSASELHAARIETNKIFSISPKYGTLKPDESCIVSFAYKHVFESVDSIPVVIRMNSRSDVPLTLSSETLPVNTPNVPILNTVHEFESVPIGIPEVPTQMYALHNNGDIPAVFELDFSGLAHVKTSNFNFPVFECGMRTGIIPPRGFCEIPWRFHPLEAKMYEVDVPLIIAGDPNTVMITFRGRGILPPSETATPSTKRMVRMHIPNRPCLLLDNQFAQISSDCVDFGVVPAFGISRRVMFLSNVSSKHAINFKWQTGVLSRVLKITPSQGVVEAGQAVLIKMILYANDGPQIHDTDIVCEIMDELVLQNHRAAVHEHHMAKERAQNEFIYTDKGRTGPARAGGYVPPRGTHPTAPSTMLPINYFADHAWPTGVQPPLSASFSNSLRPNRPLSETLRSVSKTGQIISTTILDSELRSKKYIVSTNISVRLLFILHFAATSSH